MTSCDEVLEWTWQNFGLYLPPGDIWKDFS